MNTHNKKHSKTINIRLTEAEYLTLQDIRNKYNVSVSELVRESLLFYNYKYPLK